MNFFDLQVNGYAGIDFNSASLTPEQARVACEAMLEDGTAGALATVITDSMEGMKGKLQRLVRAREEDEVVRKVLVGFHIEGPFLNQSDGFIGAHPCEQARDAAVDEMKELLDAADGLTRIVTLAPECDEGSATTRFLAGEGIVVSAGHCDPSLNQLRAAIDAGLSMFTHLGNGCPLQLQRHDNIVERVLSLSEDLWICFIGDGVHVPPYALRNYLRAAGIERSLMVTDAISAARAGPGKYTLAGWDLEIGEDMIARSPDGSHFVGSTATMPLVADVLQEMGMEDEEITDLCCKRPREVIGYS